MTLLKDDTRMIIDNLEQAYDLLQECRLRLDECSCEFSAYFIYEIQKRIRYAIRKYKRHLKTAEED